MSRVYARQAALHVATESMRWILGADDGADAAQLSQALNMPAIHAAQRGLLADMDRVVQALQQIS
jgi:hypothetical protein